MAKFDPKILAGTPRRNKFSLSYYTRLTSRMGDLVPVMCKKIIPSDRFRVSMNAITRFAPLANPIYDRIRIDYDAFFVQNRIIDPDWEAYITGGLGLYGQESTEGMIDLTIATAATTSSAYVRGNLLDYLGLQFSHYVDPGSGVNFVASFNALPVLGYLKIYEDWYRNERFQSPMYSDLIDVLTPPSRIFNLNSTALIDKYLSLQSRNYFKDPFTTALAEPLIGGPIPIMTGNITVDADAAVTTAQTIRTYGNDGKHNVGFAANNLMRVSLAGVASNTVQQLNQMYALYRFFMKDTYNGNRYVEFYESHFNVHVPDSTLQRPLFLGRYTQVASFSEIFQTSGSTAESNTLGDYAGKGVAAGSGYLFDQTFDEHGLLYVIMSIVPESTYFQGVSDVFLYGTRFETNYFPEFQNIGDDVIPLAYLYFDSSVSGLKSLRFSDVNEHVFGYNRRNWQYIWYKNEVHGDFINENSMLNWTFARRFSNAPVLGDTFSKVPHINSPFTYTANDAHTYYTDIYFQIDALRPIERYESITTH